MGLGMGMNALFLGIHGQSLSVNGLRGGDECTIFRHSRAMKAHECASFEYSRASEVHGCACASLYGGIPYKNMGMI
jgi:hypothetical protein